MHTDIYVFNCVFVCYIDKSGEEVGLVLCISLRSGRGRGRQGLDAAPEEMYQRSRGEEEHQRKQKMGFDIREAPVPEEKKWGLISEEHQHQTNQRK